MNNSEQRRKELLEQMRKSYDERREPPAVHPRYQSAYSQLYNNQEETKHASGTFLPRLFLSFLLFAAFVIMDRQDYEVLHVDSAQIIREVGTDFTADLAEVWKNL